MLFKLFLVRECFVMVIGNVKDGFFLILSFWYFLRMVEDDNCLRVFY